MRYNNIYIILLLLFPVASWGQSEELLQMEREINQLRGTERAEKKLQLAKKYQEQGVSVKALQLAQQVYEEVGRNDRLKGMALFTEAKVLASFDKNRDVYLQQAANKLVESYQLIRRERMPRMKADILSMMRNIEEETGYVPEDMRDIFKREKQDRNISGVFSGRKKNQELTKQLDLAKTQLETIDSQNVELQSTLAEQEAAIEQMTKDQMRTELALLKTQSLLDSAMIRNIQDSLALQRQAFQLQEAELSLVQQQNQRNLLFGISGFVLLFAAGLFTRYRSIRKYNRVLTDKNRIIEEEREKSESLLLNILPEAVANELKKSGKATARRYDQATVLFTDFRDFTKISEQMPPETLVQELDYCFGSFDRIVAEHGLEKIKTIGDAYMCAGGLPKPDGSHVISVVKAALDIQAFLREWKLEKVEQGEPYFEARIGIHSGPLVAGVVGKNKFAYDVWGDTVNIAARIESSGEVGEVNISDATYSLIKDKFNCEHRGKMPVKNKQPIDMYFVKAEAS